jgi:pimeloyl-ACP methyl ester carboxylesterase
MITRLIAALSLLLLACPAIASDAPQAHCGIGTYHLPGGDVIDIGRTSGERLRWRKFDGTTGALTNTDGVWKSTAGWTDKPDGIEVRFACEEQTLRFGDALARRLPLVVEESRFTAADVELAGRLLMPPGNRKVPIVILVHGSEDSSALDFYAEQRLLPARGVGVFVYDKRGTGASGGKYTQDFPLLADDAVAAMREARRLAGTRAKRVGYFGTSQGGWVAPLAARRAPVDFVIVGYGLAVSVIDEDLQAIELEMRLKGHDPATIAKAHEVAKAAHVVIESGFTQGFEGFDAVRARYRDEPWYRDLHGNFTHFFLGMSETQLRAAARQFDWKTPWRYDPMPELRSLDVPQLWVLGEDDLDAPSAETARLLGGLITAGKPITVAMFPGAEHGMTEFEIAADGSRVSTWYSPGYFDILRDYALKGRVAGRYGRARLTRP